MAHFAKLDQNNIVTTVHVVHNNELLVDGVENEQKGIDFLNTLHKTNDNWKQTSYNTEGGVHKLGGTPFRKNHAGIGFTYDEAKDAFIPPKLYPSWILNEETCQWDAPVTYPDDDPNSNKTYDWNEETNSWEEKS
jgi:hypothetical protein|tara:strand:+ start:320 stop:724 length:405 start_codon:yes stop_codon:yes gene_type:complete